MAEARSAVGKLIVPPNLLEGRDSYKDLYAALRKSIFRRYYRTRYFFTLQTNSNFIFILKIPIKLYRFIQKFHS